MTDKELTLKYQKATNKLILLDYDGTLVNFQENPENAIPTKELNDILLSLYDKPNIKIIIITGRSYQAIDRLIGHLPMDIIAEHGAMYKQDGKWINNIPDNGLWKDSVLPLLLNFILICKGSFIEEKDHSIAWHYRNAEEYWERDHSRDLIDLLEKIIDSCNFKILDGNKVIEIMSKNIGKGIATKRVIEQNNYDFILSVGDDATDEEMFDFLQYNDNAVTIKVGNGVTTAKYRLDKIENVILLLENLSTFN